VAKNCSFFFVVILHTKLHIPMHISTRLYINKIMRRENIRRRVLQETLTVFS